MTHNYPGDAADVDVCIEDASRLCWTMSSLQTGSDAAAAAARVANQVPDKAMLDWAEAGDEGGFAGCQWPL
jgi:hypothetical protein